jgi:hypothetical protein
MKLDPLATERHRSGETIRETEGLKRQRGRNTCFDSMERTTMSVAEIQEAVASIKSLPADDRIRVSHWTIAEVEHEADYAAFDQAFAGGYYEETLKKALADYRAGNVLTEIY